MEVIVPRAMKRIFSFTQMRYSCCSDYEMGTCRQGSNVTGGDSGNLVCSCLLLRFSKSGSRALKMVVPRFEIKWAVSIK